MSTKLHVSKVKHSFAKRCIRYSLPNLINKSPTCITDKLFTHSFTLKGLSHYAKHHALNLKAKKGHGFKSCIAISIYQLDIPSIK